MLTGQDLRYYEVGEPRARGVIVVRDIKRVRPLTPRGQFEIAALSGRTYLLMAGSDKERASWMSAINDAQFSPSLLARLLRQVEDLEISGLIDLEVSPSVSQCVSSPHPPTPTPRTSAHTNASCCLQLMTTVTCV